MADGTFRDELMRPDRNVANRPVRIERCVLVLQELSAEEGFIGNGLSMISCKEMNLLVNKGTNFGDMQLSRGAFEERLRIRDIEHGDRNEHVQWWFLEQVVQEGGIVDGELLK